MKDCSEISFLVENFGEDETAVTDMIGFPPSSVVSAGWSSFPANPVWFFRLPDHQRKDIDGGLAAMLAHLSLHAEGVAKVMKCFKVRNLINLDDTDWIFPLDPQGYRAIEFGLAPHTLSKLAELGVPLSFSIFRSSKP